MKRDDNERTSVSLSDKYTRIGLYIAGYSRSVFGEIDNFNVLEGSFAYDLYKTGEWGFGEFYIRKESIHSIVHQLRDFIRSDQIEVHIDEELKIDMVRDREKFALVLSINDQKSEDYISVKKTLSYQNLYKTLLKPLYTISKTYP